MLDNRNVLVIEAGEDIGPHICLQLALAGCRIISLAPDEKKQEQVKKTIEDVRGAFSYYVVRDSNKTTVGKVVKDIFDRFGGVHFVINGVVNARPEPYSYTAWEVNQYMADVDPNGRLTFYHHFMNEYARKISNGQNIIRLAHIIDLVPSSFPPALPEFRQAPGTMGESTGPIFRAGADLSSKIRFSRLYLDGVDVPRSSVIDTKRADWPTRPKFSPTLIANEILSLLTDEIYRDVNDISLGILGRDVYVLWHGPGEVGTPRVNKVLRKIRRGSTLNTFLQETQDRGLGVFAAKEFRRGDLILETTGTVLQHQTEHSIQIGWDRHLEPDPPVRFINHSCDPNAGVKTSDRGLPDIIAFTDIKVGEEIMFDYAMTEFKHYERENPDLEFSLACRCGAQNCRGKLGYFSELSDTLKKKYGVFISDYLRGSPGWPGAGREMARQPHVE